MSKNVRKERKEGQWMTERPETGLKRASPSSPEKAAASANSSSASLTVQRELGGKFLLGHEEERMRLEQWVWLHGIMDSGEFCRTGGVKHSNDS